jgi:aryl-alcohol dehydrogenase-like predicted oxidoreductase
MTNIAVAGTFTLGDRTVNRMGYGAMQLAGPGVFGPPKDRAEAIAVLHEAVAAGVDHIDTSDFYGPYVVNEIIREALHPYQPNLTIATKVGARRGNDGSWLMAQSPAELTAAVHDNLRHLGVDVLDVVNMRIPGGGQHGMGLSENSIAEQFGTLAKLREQGLIRHLGVSNASSAQIAEARGIASVVCVQNFYNIVHREDDAMIDELASQNIAYVPFFPLGGFSPLQSEALSAVAKEIGVTPLQTALAWLLQRSTSILLIPGTSSRAHLRENLAAAELKLSDAVMSRLNSIGRRTDQAGASV